MNDSIEILHAIREETANRVERDALADAINALSALHELARASDLSVNDPGLVRAIVTNIRAATIVRKALEEAGSGILYRG